MVAGASHSTQSERICGVFQRPCDTLQFPQQQAMEAQERQAQMAQQAQLAQTLILTITRNLGLRQLRAQTEQTATTGLMDQRENPFLLLLFLWRWQEGLVAQKA